MTAFNIMQRPCPPSTHPLNQPTSTQGQREGEGRGKTTKKQPTTTTKYLKKQTKQINISQKKHPCIAKKKERNFLKLFGISGAVTFEKKVRKSSQVR